MGAPLPISSASLRRTSGAGPRGRTRRPERWRLSAVGTSQAPAQPAHCCSRTARGLRSSTGRNSAVDGCSPRNRCPTLTAGAAAVSRWFKSRSARDRTRAWPRGWRPNSSNMKWLGRDAVLQSVGEEASVFVRVLTGLCCGLVGTSLFASAGRLASLPARFEGVFERHPALARSSGKYRRLLVSPRGVWWQVLVWRSCGLLWVVGGIARTLR